MTGRADRTTESLRGRVLWILGGKILAFAFSVVLPLLLVRRMSQAEFGLYKQTFLVIGTAVAVLPLGFGMTVYYFFPRHPLYRPSVVLNVLLLYSAVGAAAFLGIVLWPEALARILVGQEAAAQNPGMTAQLISFAPLIGAVIFFWVFSSFIEAVAVANDETRHAAAFIVAAQFTKSALLVTAAVLSGTVRTLLYAALAQGLLQTATLFGYVRLRFPGFFRAFDWGMLKKQIVYAAPYSLSGLLWSVQLDMHNYFVSHNFGAVGFAIYAVGVFQLPLISLISESLASVLIPRVSALQAADDRRGIIDLAAAATIKLAAVILPIYAFLMVAGREFITTLFTDQYLASLPLFRINITVLLLAIVPLDPIFRAYGELGRFVTKVRIGSMPLMASVLWLAVSTRDLRVVAAATTMIYIGEALVMGQRAARVLGVRGSDITILSPVIRLAGVCAIAALVAVVLRLAIAGHHYPAAIVLAVQALGFGLVYLSLLVSLDIANARELASLGLRRVGLGLR